MWMQISILYKEPSYWNNAHIGKRENKTSGGSICSCWTSGKEEGKKNQASYTV
jgi:hypothetical protein